MVKYYDYLFISPFNELLCGLAAFFTGGASVLATVDSITKYEGNIWKQSGKTTFKCAADIVISFYFTFTASACSRERWVEVVFTLKCDC